MFERFTDRARRVVVLAQEEARLLNHDYVGTEHLLLGMIAEGQGVAAKALESLGISLEAVRAQVEEIIGQGQQAPSGHIPFTPRAKKVLELSLREANQLGHNYIGTEHLLLGLIREGEGVAAQVLVKLDADLPRVRQQVIQLLSGYAGGKEGMEAGARTRLVRMTVPAALLVLTEELAQVRRQKEAAVDAEDFDQATELRDAEKELAEAADQRQLSRVVGRYGRLDLLLLDELGYLQLDPRGAELLFQIITEREERASIAIGTNLPFSEWEPCSPTPASSPPSSTGSPSTPTSSRPAPSPTGSPPARPAIASEPASFRARVGC
jgi:ATP-dependent Clp protease ATP-binding subunit ClpA